jgi:hypothetical protein
MNALDRAQHLSDLKDAYEEWYPEAKRGGDVKSKETRKNLNGIIPLSSDVAGTIGIPATETTKTSVANPITVSVFKCMSEAERIALAARIVNEAVQPRSAPHLQRLIRTAQATLLDIKSMSMVEELPETSSVDPEFFKVFLGWHNRVDRPTLMQSYRFAVLSVQRDRLTCKVPAEWMVRHALTKMRTDN